MWAAPFSCSPSLSPRSSGSWYPALLYSGLSGVQLAAQIAAGLGLGGVVGIAFAIARNRFFSAPIVDFVDLQWLFVALLVALSRCATVIRDASSERQPESPP
jgi:hypothetical protein